MELCAATLSDYVNNDSFNKYSLDPVDVLYQAMDGLTYLHSLDIGEYKPTGFKNCTFNIFVFITSRNYFEKNNYEPLGALFH